MTASNSSPPTELTFEDPILFLLEKHFCYIFDFYLIVI